ncbi:MAG TPA: hypothetical protein VM581_02675 [Magnetospirillaceae bacterium]|nr:hypothetical protein [Magnetospirillaceae bacterium]
MNTDEQVDIIDESGALIRITFKDDAHRDGSLHVKEQPSLFGDAHHFVVNAFPAHFVD